MRPTVRRLRDCCVGLRSWPTPASAMVPETYDGIPWVNFLCNVRSRQSRSLSLYHLQNRGYQSCAH